jgi:hypothetical protein
VVIKGIRSFGLEIMINVERESVSKPVRRLRQGGFSTALREYAIALGVKFIPIDNLRLIFDGMVRQGHETHGANGAEGFAGDAGHGTVELGLGHKANSFWLGGRNGKNQKSRLPRPTGTHKRHEKHSNAVQ